MRVIFMGTPDFAVPSLKSLMDEGHEICAVFTQPDKPKGRKLILTPSPVKELATAHGIDVYQPKTLRTEEVAGTIRTINPDVIIVVAYGKILSKEVLDIPRFGCINVHGSLLPKYRGAAPIQWSVLNGDKITGVTTMFMLEGLDTGDILLSESTEIGEEETSGELYDRLSLIGARLLTRTLKELESGTLKRTPQTEENSSYVSILTKELSPVDWNKPASVIHNQVRGLSPWPVANTVFSGKRLKVFRCKIAEGFYGKVGQVIVENGRFFICCGENTAVELLEIQYEGGKKMSGKDFLRGHSIGNDTIVQ